MEGFPEHRVINAIDSVPLTGNTGEVYFDTSKGGTFYMDDKGNWVQIEVYNKWKELKRVLVSL